MVVGFISQEKFGFSLWEEARKVVADIEDDFHPIWNMRQAISHDKVWENYHTERVEYVRHIFWEKYILCVFVELTPTKK